MASGARVSQWQHEGVLPESVPYLRHGRDMGGAWARSMAPTAHLHRVPAILSVVCDKADAAPAVAATQRCYTQLVCVPSAGAGASMGSRAT